MERFFSCDWGTSSFRLKLADVNHLRVIAEETGSPGILRTFELWKETKNADEKRSSFYCRIIENNIRKLEEKLKTPLKGLPVILSGMASSNLGICELPYKELPFPLDGSDLIVRNISASESIEHDLVIISGARTDNELMRGEETQLVGCDHSPDKKEIFIFPGTHSKHIRTENGMAIDIKTYMTGEFFELLSQKSILSSSIEKSGNHSQENEIKSFEEGIQDSLQSNILNKSFRVRINALLNKKSTHENYHYLSGLLIGTELKELMPEDDAAVTIVGDTAHSLLYEMAFKFLNRYKSFPSPKIQPVDEAVIKGQLRIYTHNQ